MQGGECSCAHPILHGWGGDTMGGLQTHTSPHPALRDTLLPAFVVWLHQTSGPEGRFLAALEIGRSLPSRAAGSDPGLTFPR